MKVAIIASPGPGNPHILGKQLSKGIIKTGDECLVFGDPNLLRNYHQEKDWKPDVVCCWGLKRAKRISENQGYKNILIMERAYLGDRLHWTSLGWNGLNGYAVFPTPNKADRWEQHFQSMLNPWKVNQKGYALVLGQVPTDASVAHINYRDWIIETIWELQKRNFKVMFRGHPEAKGILVPPAGVGLPTGNLKQALNGAAFAVNFNSNSGVDAVLNGTPCVTLDRGSMAWNITSHDLDNPIITPDRTEWSHNIAYCQWLPEELESGIAWEYVKAAMPTDGVFRHPSLKAPEIPPPNPPLKPKQNVTLFYTTETDKKVAEMFSEGLKKNDVYFTILPWNHYNPSEIAVSVGNKGKKIMDRQFEKGLPYLDIVQNTETQYSISKNGRNEQQWTVEQIQNGDAWKALTDNKES